MRVRFIETPTVVDHQATEAADQRALQYAPAREVVTDQVGSGHAGQWTVAPTTATVPTRQDTGGRAATVTDHTVDDLD